MTDRTHLLPPEDVEPEDLVAQLMELPRPSEIVPWPGKTPIQGYRDVRIIIPPEVEYSKARLAAHRRMKEVATDIPVDEWQTEALRGILSDLVAKEMISRVYYSVKPIQGQEDKDKPQYKRLFHTSKHLEAVVGKQEIEILFNLFVSAEHRLGPRMAILSADDIDVWIKKLKDGLSPLALLALPDLLELIHGLLKRDEARSSSGSQTQGSQLSKSPDTSGWEDQTDSVTSTSSSGEPQDPEPFG